MVVKKAMYSDVPETELDEETCQGITQYIDSRIQMEKQDKVLWLYGSEGTGKSALLKDLKERLSEEDSKYTTKAVGSYSFDSGDVRDETLAHFIPTLAYQFANGVEAAKPKVYGAILRDSTVLQADVETQWKRLLIKPVRHIHRASPTPVPPAIMIIDNMYYCKEHATQIWILKLMIMEKCDPNWPITFIIVTRPPNTISRPLVDLLSNLCRASIDLGTWTSMRPHIRSHFTRFLNNHRDILRYYSSSGTWPSDDIINLITTAANGKGLFVQTLLKYLECNDNPHQRLVEIMHVAGVPSLDTLYMQIVKSSHKPEDTDSQDLLYLICSDILQDGSKTFSRIVPILGLTADQCHSRMRKLQPVFDIPRSFDEEIHIRSLLFVKFLFDKDRSDSYYTDEKDHAARIMARCLSSIQRGPPRDLAFCWWNCSDKLRDLDAIPRSLAIELKKFDFDSSLEGIYPAFFAEGIGPYRYSYRRFTAMCQRLKDASLTEKYAERAIEHAMLATWLILHYTCLLQSFSSCPPPNSGDTLRWGCEVPVDGQHPSWRGFLTLVRAYDAQHNIGSDDAWYFGSRGMVADELVCASLAIFNEDQCLQTLSKQDFEHFITWSRAWSTPVACPQPESPQCRGQNRDELLKQKIITQLRQLPYQYHYHGFNRENVLSWLQRNFSDSNRPADLVSYWEGDHYCTTAVPKLSRSSRHDLPLPRKIDSESSTFNSNAHVAGIGCLEFQGRGTNPICRRSPAGVALLQLRNNDICRGQEFSSGVSGFVDAVLPLIIVGVATAATTIFLTPRGKPEASHKAREPCDNEP